MPGGALCIAVRLFTFTCNGMYDVILAFPIYVVGGKSACAMETSQLRLLWTAVRLCFCGSLYIDTNRSYVLVTGKRGFARKGDILFNSNVSYQGPP
ncbi:unnamed protein product [Cylicocyclus nassatus]|uniref:Uncharacterized protein n=1 Tax=Cylicocyclus nassatus TaxID=53992 RepID=A0AA36GWF2_CYLNA|nr:unnamed protein product [Cylicocyclus nassatus]